MPGSRAPSNAQLLHALQATRTDLSTEACAQRLDDLRALGRRRPRSLHEVVGRHDLLLFLRAFPPTVALHRAAAEGLARIGRDLRRLPPRLRARVDDTGIEGSVSRHTFDHGIARWLAQRFPRDAEIDWTRLTDSTALDALLRPLLQRAEEDSFEAGDCTSRDWVRMARGDRAAGDLAWVLQALEHAHIPAAVLRAEWEAAAIPIAWRLRAPGASVTTGALPVGTPVLRHAFRPAPVDPLRHVAAPLDAVRLLPRADARRTIDLARATLAARCREVFAISHANPSEVWEADLGEGATLAIIGVEPGLRMSLEANYGYLLLSNGVPIGYGGVTPLFRQANTGINVFDPFRGAEAAFLWAQALRAFHSLFGVRRFVVNAYQFGEGNLEAIRSGAFWFYHRLGFRPADPTVRRLAAAEAAHRRRDPRHRTDESTLRRLASGDLQLTLPGFVARDAFDESWLARLAGRVTALLADSPHRDRTQAVAALARDVAVRLGARPARWSPAERTAFTRLAPVVALLPLERWSSDARRGIVALMRAKGHAQERDFVRAAARHPRLFRALEAEMRARTGGPARAGRPAPPRIA